MHLIPIIEVIWTDRDGLTGTSIGVLYNGMAWIHVIDEENATGRLAELYAKLIEPWGGVDNIMKIHSLNTPSLKAHFELYKTLMRGRSDLTRIQREMIAVVVSSINRCHY